MLLGELIARLKDDTVAGEALVSLGNLAMVARLVALAAERNVPVGQLVAQAVGQFVNGASDEEWLSAVGHMSGAADPGRVFLHRALMNAAPA